MERTEIEPYKRNIEDEKPFVVGDYIDKYDMEDVII